MIVASEVPLSLSIFQEMILGTLRILSFRNTAVSSYSPYKYVQSFLDHYKHRI